MSRKRNLQLLKDYQRYTVLSWKRQLHTSQAIDRGLRTPRTQQHLQEYFIATPPLSSVVIARVSTCRTQQVYWK